jgi:ABC-2 type transport system permease protein
MRKTLTVAWREFRDTAMTKAFLFGAIVMPIFTIGLFIIVIPLLQTEDEPLDGTVAVFASDDVVTELQLLLIESKSPLQEQLEQLPEIVTQDPIAKALLTQTTKSTITVESIDETTANEMKSLVLDGTYLAYINVPDSLVQSVDSEQELTVFIPNDFANDHTNFITRNAENAVVNARLKRQGHDPTTVRALLKRPNATTMRVQEDGELAKDNEIARAILPIAFIMLLWIAAFTSGNYLLTTTIEEKSNKVIEVLLSAISPMQLLGGKIIGQAGVSAVILGMYGSAAIAGLVTFALMDIVTFSQLGLFLVYFIMGYFMIATMMVAVGSAVSELSDAQSLMGPMMLLFLVPMMLWPVISQHPYGSVAITTSYIPPLIPFVMIIRMASATEPIMMWEILLSIGVGYIAVLCMVWMCARIFRIGILMQGKPPNILQLAKWIRQG